MRDKRRHKTFVVTDDETWIAFRALVMVRGTTIEHALGRLVERIVRSPAPMEPRAVIGAQQPARSRLAADDAAGAGPAAKRRRKNTRSSRPKA